MKTKVLVVVLFMALVCGCTENQKDCEEWAVREVCINETKDVFCPKTFKIRVPESWNIIEKYDINHVTGYINQKYCEGYILYHDSDEYDLMICEDETDITENQFGSKIITQNLSTGEFYFTSGGCYLSEINLEYELIYDDYDRKPWFWVTNDIYEVTYCAKTETRYVCVRR